jgi:uncharacterized protein (TIGR02646 family)
MIRIRNRSLPEAARDGLGRYQAHVDEAADYPGRVERAKAHFQAKNKASDAVFRVVREHLDRMCQGPRRCMYCEDAPADEVEHFRPKDLYPEQVFAWANYLYACGPCNGPKNNRFAVVDARSTPPAVRDVGRKRSDPIVPPWRGRPALIDPRREDPLDFLQLDLLGTFEFVPIAPAGTLARIRAEYTLQVLRLNDRDYLVEARENAYWGFLHTVGDYIRVRGDGASRRELGRYAHAVRRATHQTVWAEMKRQYSRVPSLTRLFGEAPEALAW